MGLPLHCQEEFVGIEQSEQVITLASQQAIHPFCLVDRKYYTGNWWERIENLVKEGRSSYKEHSGPEVEEIEEGGSVSLVPTQWRSI